MHDAHVLLLWACLCPVFVPPHVFVSCLLPSTMFVVVEACRGGYFGLAY